MRLRQKHALDAHHVFRLVAMPVDILLWHAYYVVNCLATFKHFILQVQAW